MQYMRPPYLRQIVFCTREKGGVGAPLPLGCDDNQHLAPVAMGAPGSAKTGVGRHPQPTAALPELWGTQH